MRRLRRGALAALAALLAAPAVALPGDDAGFRTPSDPSYALYLRADATGTHWAGRESVSFLNDGPAPLGRVWLRLWDNGVAGAGCAAPAIRVSSVEGAHAGTLAVGCTALPLDLPAPLAPGQRARVAFRLAIDVPDHNDRFGEVGGEVLAGNAIPVLAIQDANGPHLDPYVAFGESFYSQIGRFRVVFDTPHSLAVAASGVLTGAPRPSGGGRLTRTFLADRVRDFAWAAGPLRERSAVDRDGVRIRVWFGPRIKAATAEQALGWARTALPRLAAAFGPYPYGEVDVVLVRFSRFGGMEYPTLVMTAPLRVAVVHELAHQWWYGMVGDDEYHEPWLDEAFATWSEAKVDGHAATLCKDVLWPSPQDRVTLGMDWWAHRPRAYAATVYRQGACALQALSDKLGAHVFDRLLRTYADDHRYGWSTTAAFVAAADAAAAAEDPPVDLSSLWAEHRIG